MYTTHELADAELASIARGRGGVPGIRKLLAGYRSKLLVSLRALLDLAPTELGPLPPLGEAWDLLIEAERVDPPAVADVLGLPEVQGWAADTLRLVTTTKDRGQLWPFVGQLHAVAAAAAIRAGIDCKARIPVVNGVIALPGLGIAPLSSHDHAELMVVSRRVLLRTPDGTVELPTELAADGPSWLAQRRIRCEHAGKVLDVGLDDIQPYRFCGIRPSKRLSADEFEGWRQRLDRAWQLLATDHPDTADELATGVSALVPRTAVNRFRLSSASTVDAFGTMEVAPVDDAATVASILIHEFSHSILNGVLALVALDVEDRRETYYAPWRDDPRPLHGLLHGAYSFLAVTDFWGRERHDDPARNLEFATRRGQVAPALEAIAKSGLLTEAGELFVSEMRVVADGWADGEVAPPVRKIADRVLADHRATWRIRHYRPSARQLRQAVGLWQNRETWTGHDSSEPDLMPTLDPVVEARARTHLTQWSLSDPTAFAAVTEGSVEDEVPGATAADLALVKGDTGRARTLYAVQIKADPHDHAGWIGLGLAAGHRCLLEFPELVQAVHVAGPGDPEKLAAWFDAALT
jgi:HEXXH motif-containing protein